MNSKNCCIFVIEKENNMRLAKRLENGMVVSAHYNDNGLTLCLTNKEDKFSNPIAIVEEVNGETHLVLVDNALQRYGVKITHEDITPKEW